MAWKEYANQSFPQNFHLPPSFLESIHHPNKSYPINRIENEGIGRIIDNIPASHGVRTMFPLFVPIPDKKLAPIFTRYDLRPNFNQRNVTNESNLRISRTYLVG